VNFSYVDSQLRTSKRFDAAGIERDYPDLFEPVPSRARSSRSSSSLGLNKSVKFSMTARSHSVNGGSPSYGSGYNSPNSEELGQLRYWTADMCTDSPHLFDFVVTVSGPHFRHMVFSRGADFCRMFTSRIVRWRWNRPVHLVALPTHRPTRYPLCARLAGVPHQL
jgi:hypothetical protein